MAAGATVAGTGDLLQLADGPQLKMGDHSHDLRLSHAQATANDFFIAAISRREFARAIHRSTVIAC